jgi:beta-aspartyl-peptidase (threonine type)
MKAAIIVHGGAGDWQSGSQRLEKAVAACVEAAAAGQAILTAAGSALDAVEAAVRVLEDNPVVDAGRGSYLNAEGEIEMDALIMDGRTLDLGAVAAVKCIRNPITLARRVMVDSQHTFLVGSGAEAFADSIGFPRCPMADLIVAENVDVFDVSQAAIGDTVGAVALDEDGNLAAATSTGGTRNKLPGRVGDSPLVGSGGYADNRTAAVSATGYGEALMKIVIGKQTCDYVSSGLSAQAACETAIRLLEERLKGHGGLIAVDWRGRVGYAYNTTAMPHAFALGDESVMGGR